MNRRGVEVASAFLLLAGTLGGCAQQSDWEYNTRARATETARWQDTDPTAIFLGSVIVEPNAELKVRTFPRVIVPGYKPDNIISWANIFQINGTEINNNRFLIRYPKIVFGEAAQFTGNLTYPAHSPWIQLDGQVNDKGKVSNQKLYISLSDQTEDYLFWQRSNRRDITRSISFGMKAAGGFQLYPTNEVMPDSDINQVSVCAPDSPCVISPNESEVLAGERLLRRVGNLTYRYYLIQGDALSPDNPTYYGNFFVDKANYLRYGQNKIRMPISFEFISGNDILSIALSEGFSGGSIKNAIMLSGRDMGKDITLCSPQSEEKTAVYEALLDNFVPNGVVERRLLLTLAQGATGCVTR